MEVSPLGQLNDTSITLAKQNKVNLDVFQELFQALFINITNSFSIEEGMVNESNQNKTSKIEMNLDLMQIPLFNNPCTIDRTINYLKNNANDIDEILIKLGIKDKKELELLIRDFITKNEAKEIENPYKKVLYSKLKERIKYPNEKIFDKEILTIPKYTIDENAVKNIPVEKLKVKAFNMTLEEKVIFEPEESITMETKDENLLVLNNKNDVLTSNIAKKSLPEKQITQFITKPEDLVDLTVNKFKTLRIPGYTEVKVKLKPEELGDITVKVVLEKGQINGSIIAEKKESYLMLQNQIDYLKQELKNNNIDFNNITINYNSSDDFNGHASKEFNHQEKNKTKAFIMDNKEDKSDINKDDGFSIIA